MQTTPLFSHFPFQQEKSCSHWEMSKFGKWALIAGLVRTDTVMNWFEISSFHSYWYICMTGSWKLELSRRPRVECWLYFVYLLIWAALLASVATRHVPGTSIGNTSDNKDDVWCCLHEVVWLDLELSSFANKVSYATAWIWQTLNAYPECEVGTSV